MLVYRKEALSKRIEKLKEYRNDLYLFQGVSYDEYLHDKKIRYCIERLLFLLCENILDFLDHILSAKYQIVSNSYEDIIDNAYSQNITDQSVYLQLKGLVGFRNILAHNYLSLSNEEIFKNYQKMLGLLSELIDVFEGML